ncbi:hypothetical protein UFOVP1186_7 [uncultured Caudovirales phage]|uniref:Uncharacterized protein n=1 Tax=uncultured Caudovirales phage TaxID=2100421 RepID=A0A6J5PX00_9CAUD|nr:hypothetical protein UFOVP959_17 [uncultured Caudovirales phage]CAB4189269.1 hypothetical protein UFOVP1186_7 [uncultured Caudovirales phage]CAB4192238.1 hypothetical protein UFOVP1234_12 [uncultured Caudovirales phage]CAB4215541.1 hypothetical protein UFOVP1487_25 [uncultured Caudovirales phage]CAB5238937.1 hypothetical protein UFOVP1574_29 [uncultured Caudovirales phage]
MSEERPFHCPNCLREWAEPFCDECGRVILTEKPVTREVDRRDLNVREKETADA